MNRIQRIVEHLLGLRARLARHRRVLTVLAAIVVFATTYALTLPAITLDNNTADDQAGIERSNTQVKAKAGDYTVTASYGEDAGLPKGAKLVVSKVKSSSGEYKSARTAVVKAKKSASKKFDEDELGMAALDIGFTDAGGNAVEPEGKVTVKVEAKQLPASAEDKLLEVRHIIEPDDEADSSAKPVAERVAKEVPVSKRAATAEFEVQSFSVFAITWNTSDDARIGSVRVHYVDSAGNELAEPDEHPETSLAQNDFTSLADWAFKDDGSSRIAGYEIADEALPGRLENVTGDPVHVSGLRVVQSGDTYELQYTMAPGEALGETTDEDWETWNSGNSLDLYLVYAKNITIHYVDLDGNPIGGDAEGEGKTETFDISEDENGLAVDIQSGYTGTTYAIDGYTFSRVSSGHSSEPAAGSQITLGSASAYATEPSFRYLRYVYESDAGSSDTGSSTISYSSDGTTWTAAESTDVYISYCPVVRVHYVDESGNVLHSTLNTTYAIYRTSGNWASYGSLFSDSGDNAIYSGLGKPSSVSDAAPSSGSTGASITIPGGVSWTYSNNQWTTTYAGSAHEGLVVDFYCVYSDKLGITVHQTGGVLQNTNIWIASGGTLSAETTGIAVDGYTAGIYLDEARTQQVDSIAYTKGDSGWTATTTGGTVRTDGNAPTEIWVYYTRTQTTEPVSATVYYHYVDKDGNQISDTTRAGNEGFVTSTNTAYQNKWDGMSVNATNVAPTISGYVFSTWYMGLPRADGSNEIKDKNTKLVWKNEYDTTTSTPGTWHSGYGTSQSPAEIKDASGNAARITDIYFVYTKAPITIHYVDASGTAISGQENATIALDGSFTGTRLLDSNDGSSSYVRDLSNNSPAYTFTGSHVSAYDGPTVSQVRVLKSGDDVSVEYLRSIDAGTHAMQVLRRNTWFYTTSSGRMFTLRKSGNNYTVIDGELAASVDLSLSSDSTSGDTRTQVYTASTENSGTKTVYTVTATTTTSGGSTTTSYTISAEEWVPSSQTDLYQVYAENTGDDGTMWLSDDMAYSGHIIVGMDQTLQDKLASNTVSDVKFTWYKSVNNATATQVERTQSGNDWNLPRLESERTWLNVSADGGALSSTQTSVSYYCVLTYTENGTAKTVTTESAPVSVKYYDSLMNGSFETPDFSNSTVTSTIGTDKSNGNGGANGGSVSNAWYKAQGGVWQTTGKGSGTHVNEDIEVINSNSSTWNKNGYSWYGNDGAKDGNQFVELNAEAAGALYQDVVTRVNNPLNYWLSHRARGTNRSSTSEYDTMYLVIMPTRLALTGGTDGGELDEQQELASFIQNHGGFATSTSRAEEEVTTYNQDGILIERISSDDRNWHSISVASGYTPTSDLTRFFFVAGPTASNNNTVGNFIDDVGFSQNLPTPTAGRFQMVVNKTFTGLELSDLDKLATNRDADGNETSSNANAFKLTVKAYNGSGENKTEDTSDPLDGAELTFRAGASSGSYSLQATKTSGGTTKNLFEETTSNGTATGGGTGTATVDDATGSVTMTWALLNNQINTGTNDYKYYAITESGESVGGLTLSSSQTATVLHSDTAPTSYPEASSSTSYNPQNQAATVTVSSQDTVIVNNTNAYRDSRNDGAPFMTVTKTFSGVTPTTVSKMLKDANSPYKVTVSKSGDSSSKVVLTGNSTTPYSGTLPEGASVSLATTQNTDGTTTLTWTILGTTDTSTNWVTDGTYAVKEENYKPAKVEGSDDQNKIVKVQVNGTDVNLTDNDKDWPSTDSTFGAGTDAASSSKLTFHTENGAYTAKQGSDFKVTDDNNQTVHYELSASTNIVVGRYTLNNTTNYLVWTQDALGLNDRARVIQQINTVMNDSTASTATVHFRNGDDPGAMTEGDGTMTAIFDSGALDLSFAQSGSFTWTGFYSTTYEGEGSAELSIGNSYSSLVKIRKIDINNASTKLEGAVFELHKGSADGEKVGTTYTTASSTGEISLGSLDPGTYYLVETTAPKGYDLLLKPVSFTVADSGVVTVVAGDANADNSRASVSFNDPYYTISVADRTGFVLPNTGGPGEGVLLIAGFALVAAAAGGIVLCRRRPRGRHSL